MRIRIEITSQVAEGKTYLANKIADFIRSESLPSQEIDVVIRSLNDVHRKWEEDASFKLERGRHVQS